MNGRFSRWLFGFCPWCEQERPSLFLVGVFVGLTLGLVLRVVL